MKYNYSCGWAAEKLASDIETEITNNSSVVKEMRERISRRIQNAIRVYERLGATQEEMDELIDISSDVSDYECLLYDVVADFMIDNILPLNVVGQLTEFLSSEQYRYLICLLQQEEQKLFRKCGAE